MFYMIRTNVIFFIYMMSEWRHIQTSCPTFNFTLQVVTLRYYQKLHKLQNATINWSLLCILSENSNLRIKLPYSVILNQSITREVFSKLICTKYGRLTKKFTATCFFVGIINIKPFIVLLYMVLILLSQNRSQYLMHYKWIINNVLKNFT